jgi:hypothetical protein
VTYHQPPIDQNKSTTVDRPSDKAEKPNILSMKNLFGKMGLEMAIKYFTPFELTYFNL